MRFRTWRSVLAAVGVVLVCFEHVAGSDRTGDASSPSVVSVDVWPGWRGLTAEGRVPQRLPTTWSAADGIRWKTPIPGRGHSSPIVFGDRIYLTTADPAISGRLLVDSLRVLTLGLVLALTALVAAFVARQSDPHRSPTACDRAVGVAMLTVVIVLIAIACLGDALFDYTRCNIRGWIASAAFATLCLGLTTAVTPDAGRRCAVGVGAIAFAAENLPPSVPHR